MVINSSVDSLQILVLQLCDHFVEAAIGGYSVQMKSAKLSPKPEVTGLDNLPNGEVLLAGVTAAICLHLLPIPASVGWIAQKKTDLDTIPLLLVAVTVALEDANRRQNRTIAGGLSKLLR